MSAKFLKQAYDFCVDIRWVDVLFRSLLSFFLHDLGVFFGEDWRRELVVRGMHVRTVFGFIFYLWYGLYLIRGTERWVGTDVFSTQAR